MLEFCEECEIFHNVSLVNGERVLNECQIKIQENYNPHVHYPTKEVIYVNPHEFSPQSKPSLTSISNHLSPKATNYSPFRQPFPNIRVNPPSPVVERINRAVPMNYLPQTTNLSPSLRINFVSPPKNVIQNMHVSRTPAAKSVSKGPFFRQSKVSNMLSTIKEEGNDESEKSKSHESSAIALASTQRQDYQAKKTMYAPLFGEEPLVTQFTQSSKSNAKKEAVYVFKNIRRKTQDDGVYEPDSPTSTIKANKENFCWCW